MPADHHPGLRFGVAVGRQRARLLVLPQAEGDVVVHHPHVAGDGATDLAILAGLGDPLDPEVRHQRLLPPRDRRQGRARSGDLRRDRLVDRGPELVPRCVEAREPQIALRGEVAVQDGLAHTRLARDLRRRGTRVAPRGEDAERRLHDCPPALLGGEPARTRGHRASAATGLASA